jgi:hypothetical protein
MHTYGGAGAPASWRITRASAEHLCTDSGQPQHEVRYSQLLPTEGFIMLSVLFISSSDYQNRWPKS